MSLFFLSFKTRREDLDALIERYAALPSYIAKKHLKAALGRAVRPHVKTLKAATPKGKRRMVRSAVKRNERGAFVKGSGKMKNAAGALRRAATVRTGWKGKNNDGFAFGVLGYKYGEESRKALWLEFGTKHIEPRRIVQRVYESVKDQVMKVMKGELAKALEKAAKELASGRNPGVGKSGYGPGRK